MMCSTLPSTHFTLTREWGLDTKTSGLQMSEENKIANYYVHIINCKCIVNFILTKVASIRSYLILMGVSL